MPKPDDVGVGTAVFIMDDRQRVLLGKRRGAHQAGTWSCPGGWLDREDETTDIAVAREALEECGITLLNTEHLCWVTEDHPEIGVRTVTLYHFARPGNWEGQPKVLEPEKCEGWEWFSLWKLPDNLFPKMDQAFSELRQKIVREEAEAVDAAMFGQR